MERYVDCHTHVFFSHDSDCLPDDLAAAARAKGLLGFAVTDHCDVEYSDRADVITPIFASVRATAALAERNPDLCILRGVELGDPISFPETARKVLCGAEYDVVLGSVHTVRAGEGMPSYARIDFSAYTDDEIAAYLHDYFSEVRQMIETTPIDVLSHLTCPLRYICGKYGRMVESERFDRQIDGILQAIIKRSVALEVNTSCVGSSYDEWMPCASILRRYRAAGGTRITVGSDAHIAARVGHGFDGIAAKLYQLGFAHLYYYKNRVPIPYDGTHFVSSGSCIPEKEK